MQVGDRYRITDNYESPDKWIRSARRITGLDPFRNEVSYLCDNGDTFTRGMRMVQQAIHYGEWVLDYPPIVALPAGV